MADELAGFPHWELRYNEDGVAVDGPAVDDFVRDVATTGLTDLYVFSHGWNNDIATARDLYRRFFEQMATVLAPRATAAKIGTAGVIWPSMRWADETPPARAGGAAAVTAAAAPPTDDQLIMALKPFFPGSTRHAALDRMAALLRTRPADEASLREFHTLIKTLTAGAPGGVTAPEDNGEQKGLLGQDAIDVFKRFAALSPQRRTGGSAGLGDIFGGLWNGAKEAARVATYWEMKKRAATVGQRGLGPLVDRAHLQSPPLRVHLIGHSFGARLVSFTLAGLTGATPSPVKSLTLLQGAFSHFAFASSLPHDPGRGGALAGMAARVDGPLCVTHSLKDTAVGTAYPLASLLSRDDSAALSDQLYRWGGMGHDGAQAVNATEVSLGAAGTVYPFAPGAFLNLDGNRVIVTGGAPSGAHSDIVHPEIAWALLAASGVPT